MHVLKRDVPRSGINGLLTLGFAGGSAYYLWVAHPTRELLIKFFAENINYLIAWVFCLVLLSYLFDKYMPQRKATWCNVTEKELLINPNGIPPAKWRALRSDVDEIRYVPKRVFYGTEIYIFLKNGKMKVLSNLRQDSANDFIVFAKNTMPEIEIRGA